MQYRTSPIRKSVGPLALAVGASEPVTEPAGSSWYADAMRELIAEVAGVRDAANEQLSGEERPASTRAPRIIQRGHLRLIHG